MIKEFYEILVVLIAVLDMGVLLWGESLKSLDDGETITECQESSSWCGI